jgi:hypothetical protein
MSYQPEIIFFRRDHKRGMYMMKLPQFRRSFWKRRFVTNAESISVIVKCYLTVGGIMETNSKAVVAAFIKSPLAKKREFMGLVLISENFITFYKKKVIWSYGLYRGLFFMVQ